MLQKKEMDLLKDQEDASEMNKNPAFFKEATDSFNTKEYSKNNQKFPYNDMEEDLTGENDSKSKYISIEKEVYSIQKD
jgi:hypothetical protein